MELTVKALHQSLLGGGPQTHQFPIGKKGDGGGGRQVLSAQTVVRTKRREETGGGLSRESISKQVSNSVPAAVSGRDPDSHQSIAVWWFLTKEVQGKNSSRGDLNPTSSG